MYVKSTNEFLHDIQDVYASLDKHLGIEYTDTVKAILATVPKGYTPDEEVEQMEKDYRQELDSYTCSISERDTALDEIEELCNELIDYIDESRRISKDKLLKKIAAIKRTAYLAH